VHLLAARVIGRFPVRGEKRVCQPLLQARHVMDTLQDSRHNVPPLGDARRNCLPVPVAASRDDAINSIHNQPCREVQDALLYDAERLDDSPAAAARCTCMTSIRLRGRLQVLPRGVPPALGGSGGSSAGALLACATPPPSQCPYTEMQLPVAVKGSRCQPSHRSLSRSPATRAIWSPLGKVDAGPQTPAQAQARRGARPVVDLIG
jgi:hypothetical protein